MNQFRPFPAKAATGPLRIHSTEQCSTSGRMACVDFTTPCQIHGSAAVGKAPVAANTNSGSCRLSAEYGSRSPGRPNPPGAAPLAGRQHLHKRHPRALSTVTALVCQQALLRPGGQRDPLPWVQESPAIQPSSTEQCA